MPVAKSNSAQKMKEKLSELINFIPDTRRRLAVNFFMTAQAQQKLAVESLRRYGITSAKMNILWILANKGPMSQSEIAKWLFVSVPNISGILDLMEKSKTIKRVAQKHDRRVKMVSVTPKGKQLWQDAMVPYVKVVEQIFGNFTDEDVATMNLLIDKSRANI